MKNVPLIYKNNRIRLMYAVSVLTLSMSIFTNYMIFSDFDAFLSEFNSKSEGIFWMIFMVLCGHILLICMLWLSNKYVLEIAKISEHEIRIKTWSIFGFHKIYIDKVEILKSSTYTAGYTRITGGPMVNAPYLKLKLSNDKKLIIDLQGRFYE